MKLDAGEIKDLVSDTERKRADWALAAAAWEKMWSLQRFDDNRKDIKELDGLEAVTTPDPYNIIQLLTRFVASDVRVEIPDLSVKDTDDARRTSVSEFLVAFEQRSNREQGRNLINDKTWMSGVRGRGASQILWVGDELKALKRRKRLPILKRNLDPLNVGVERGPFGTEYAYHKYKARRAYIEQMYPDFDIPEHKDNGVKLGFFHEEFEVVDFWCTHKGAVWHGVSIGDKFAKELIETDYPEIPIVEWMADGAPIDDELGRSLSILHPIRSLWQYKCELASKIGSGLLYYFDPIIKTIGLDEDILVGPGETVRLQPGQDIDVIRPEPNVPMAEKMLNLIQGQMDQATFPAVLYGEQPGGVQAGFAISNLADQARSRANTIRSNIEAAMEVENEIVLALIEIFGGDEGVELWGGTNIHDHPRTISLSKKIIKGNYANEVRLIPESPMDDQGRIMTWMNMVDKGIISKMTMRDRGINLTLPQDEELRVAYERALEMPEIQQKNTLRAMQARHDEKDWKLIIQGTPLQQVHEQEVAWVEQEAQREEAEREARRQEREQKRLQALLEEGKAHMMPDGSIMEGPPMEMAPPPMPPGMPPMGPEMMPPGMPGGMPPEMGPGMAPPPPPPSGGPPGPPPMGMQTPGMEGLPPQAMGQLSPDQLGIPPGAPVGQFDQMMGGPPPSDEELLRQMIGGGGDLPPI